MAFPGAGVCQAEVDLLQGLTLSLIGGQPQDAFGNLVEGDVGAVQPIGPREAGGQVAAEVERQAEPATEKGGWCRAAA